MRTPDRGSERAIVPWDGRSSNNIFPFCPDVGIAVGERMVVLSTLDEPTGPGDNIAVLNSCRPAVLKRSMS